MKRKKYWKCNLISLKKQEKKNKQKKQEQAINQTETKFTHR